MTAAGAYGAPRWRGSPGRLEVWYATFTNRADGTGVWIHHETVAPLDGAAAYGHGWIAVFGPTAAPVLERFGPGPAEPGAGWHAVAGCGIGDGWLRGGAGALTWDLTFADDSRPLFTFPRSVWARELLPAAQIVPWPSAAFTGEITIAGRRVTVDASGAVARIYGHGSAHRWGWVHADLDGEGTLEIVAATARRAGLRLLPPLALVQLRRPGVPDWPHRPLAAAPLLRTRLRPDGFSVRGRVGRRRLDVDVRIPPAGAVALTYVDPDGSTALCTNSERASATIDLGDRRWALEATVHAEVGTRA